MESDSPVKHSQTSSMLGEEEKKKKKKPETLRRINDHTTQSGVCICSSTIRMMGDCYYLELGRCS